MIKRTTGRLLLALLVISGLAGTLRTGSISIRERKTVITYIKTSREELRDALAGLTDRQFRFKPKPETHSIREMVSFLIVDQQKCMHELATCMQRPSNPEDRTKIVFTDDQLLANDIYSLCNKPSGNTNEPDFKNAQIASEAFNAITDRQIRYLRTSTEDLRNHVNETFAGWIDCYQYYLLLADQTNYVARQIREFRARPGFPSK